MTQRSFLRRNGWGLLALLPLTALFGIIALDRTDFYERFLNGQPRTAVTGAPADWVTYSGARMRLVALSATEDLLDANAKLVKLPAALKAWQAVIEIQVDDQRNMANCEILLEDSAGRLFGARPDELAAVRTPVPTCDAEDKALNAYQVTAFFVAPADAQPIAIRVMRAPALPDYARLVAA